MSYLNLKQDGPLVVQAPPGVLRMLSDFWQRPLTDVGLVMPDKGEGGQFLTGAAALRRAAAAGRLRHLSRDRANWCRA